MRTESAGIRRAECGSGNVKGGKKIEGGKMESWDGRTFMFAVLSTANIKQNSSALFAPLR